MNEIKNIKIQSIIWILIYILILIAIICLIFFHVKFNVAETKYYDYYSAKKETINFLNKNISELVYCYHSTDKKEEIEVNINLQGFLGGQYWGHIYSKDDILDSKDIDIKHISNDNNYHIRTKIQNNWYFYYDGHINVDDIK